MRFVWIPMQWSLLWKRSSSAPVQMSLGIHFCSRSPPKIRQQRKHLLNRSDTVSLFLSLTHSLSRSFMQKPLPNSMKFSSKATVCPSVHFEKSQLSKCKQHSFLVSLFLHIFDIYDKNKKNIQMGESHETCHKHIQVTFHSNQMKKKTWNYILHVNLKSVVRIIFFNAPKNRPHIFLVILGVKCDMRLTQTHI